MAKREITVGSTDQTIDVFIQDSSSTTGAGLSGLVYNSASLACYYRKGATGSATALTLATQTVGGAHSDGGFVEIQATNMKGVYRLDLSDTMVAASGMLTIMLYGATNMAPVVAEIEVVATNKYDAVRGGMTALPNANAEAAGGLYTRGTGAGQLNQAANGQHDVNVVALSGDSTAADNSESFFDGTGYAGTNNVIPLVTTTTNVTNQVTANCTAISGDTTAADNAEAFFDGTGYAGTNNVIPTVTTATNVTTVNGLAAGVITAASIAADAITDAKVASDVTIASVTGAVGSVTGNVGGNVTGSVGSVSGAVGSVTGSVGSIATGGIAAASFAAGAIDAAAIAANAIGASELAADAVAEIQSGLSTLDAAGIRTAIGMASANLDTQLGVISTDTTTDIPALIATLQTYVDTEVAAIKAKTDNLPSDPADQSAVESAITAAWTTTLTESYATDGAIATPAQLLYMILCTVSEFSISGTTITGKKLDGSTTAMTWTIDSSTDPTSRTRAS